MKIQKEQVEQALLQRLLTDPQVGIDTMMRTAALMNQGKTLMEAAEAQMAVEEAARAEQMAPPDAGGGVVSPTGPPATPEEMAAGAQPGEAAAPGAHPFVGPNQASLDQMLKQMTAPE